MSWRIWKFGGTSLGTAGRLRQVLTLIREDDGGPLVVVVSALGHSTDWLIDAARRAEAGDLAGAFDDVAKVEGLARRQAAEAGVDLDDALRAILDPLRELLRGVGLVRECTARTLDEVMSAGERISAVLLGRALGVPAHDARDLFVTDDVAQAATVDIEATTARVRAALPAGNAVVTGFIARSRSGRTTTLGRNGSDYTAALLAQALGADEVTVWTDVPGVFTADPDLVREAYPVTRLTYAEALELAHFGTRMFHSRTVVPLQASGAALTIRSTTEPHRPGTRVDATGHAADDQPTCVTSLEHLALLSIESRRSSLPPALVGQVLDGFVREGVRVWMTNQSGLGVSASFVVPVADAERAVAVLERLADAQDVTIAAPVAPVTLVSLVAERMGRRANTAGRFFYALGNVGIVVLAIAQGASQRSLSCVVAASDTALAVRTVHGAFNLAETPLHVALLGYGTVGGSLLAQVEAQRTQLRSEHGLRVELVGLFGSRSGVFDAAGLDPAGARSKLVPGVSALSRLDALARLPNPVLVDCTTATGQEALYLEAFRRGIHVVGANKKPLTLPWAHTRALHDGARHYSRSWLYETTCGASLPVIETLKNLVRTGDVVSQIDGSLSGTLGYLAGALMSGVPLSVAVRTAKERGLTEPHPRDDLSGLDVARKALILARELGEHLELEDVEIEPFIPQAYLQEPDPERFLVDLERLDAEVAAKVDGYRAAGLTFRYLAKVERTASGVRLQVGPTAVDAAHPAAGLRGEEAMVAFSTFRYRDYPLVVRGSGAGGDVTAAGVLADILRLAHNVRGRR